MRPSNLLILDPQVQFYQVEQKDFNLFRFKKIIMKIHQQINRMISIQLQQVDSLKARVLMSSKIMPKLLEIAWEVLIHNL